MSFCFFKSSKKYIEIKKGGRIRIQEGWVAAKGAGPSCIYLWIMKISCFASFVPRQYHPGTSTPSLAHLILCYCFSVKGFRSNLKGEVIFLSQKCDWKINACCDFCYIFTSSLPNFATLRMLFPTSSVERWLRTWLSSFMQVWSQMSWVSPTLLHFGKWIGFLEIQNLLQLSDHSGELAEWGVR